MAERAYETEAFLQLNLTDACTEGANRSIQRIERVGCGFANLTNYQRQILAGATVPAAA